MALDYAKLMAMPPLEVEQTYAARDTILYALGIGAGQQDASADLPYLFEEGLEAFPTMAVILGYSSAWLRQPQMGVDWKRMLHGEESLILHHPLPAHGTVVSVLTIDEIYDKGADKGAVMIFRREIHDKATGDHLATDTRSAFLRGDGGCGGNIGKAPAPSPAVTDRAADSTVLITTRPDQALLYRLSGDYNPIHADPVLARQAGFDGPILHGLCTYGCAGRAVVRALCGGRADRLRRLDVRFASPVYPGETLRFDIWNDGDCRARLRATAVERDLVVLTNGYAEFGA